MLTSIFKTKNSFYLYSHKHNKTILLHPCLAEIIRQEEKIPGPGTIGEGDFSHRQKKYYHKKYLLLKENGYFDPVDPLQRIKGRYTGEDLSAHLAGNNHLVFEVTDKCNLRCSYCIYGDLYQDFSQRATHYMDPAKAKNIFDYMVNRWNSPKNRSHNKGIRIGFYGGESLMNISFIKEMVSYARKTPLKHNYFTFGLTTNGTLLDKHMDYLVENRFHILVSLDGDEKSNGYRVFHDGRPIYETVINNIEKLRRRFPAYFEKYVNFNAVLHRLNTLAGIYHFFKSNFNKTPHITEVSLFDVKDAKRKAVERMWRGISESFEQAEENEAMLNDLAFQAPPLIGLIKFIHRYSDDSFKKIEDLLPGSSKSTLPTSSCMPLKLRIFVTVDGNILPCERVSHQHVMGRVTADKVEIDFDKIAEKYNHYFDRLRKQCVQCVGVKSCFICVLKLEKPEKGVECPYMIGNKEFETLLSETVGYLEENPGHYKQISEEISLA